MRNEELKEVMISGEPVKHRGVTYSHITAIIYRKSETGVFIQAELKDINRNCVVLVRPDEITRAGADAAND